MQLLSRFRFCSGCGSCKEKQIIVIQSRSLESELSESFLKEWTFQMQPQPELMGLSQTRQHFEQMIKNYPKGKQNLEIESILGE